MSNDSAGFSYESNGKKITAPAPSQTVWDTLLAVLVGAAIVLAAGMAQSDSDSWNNH